MEPERSARSDLRIDRPLLPERPPSGRLVSGRRGQAGVDSDAGVCGDLRPGRLSGRRPPAGHQRGHGWSLRLPTRAGAAGPDQGPLLPQATAVLVPACGPDTVASRRADGRGVPQGRGRRVGPCYPPQPATVSGCGQPDGCGGVQGVRGCWRSCDGVRSAGVRRGHCGQGMSAATGSGRLTGVRWWGAATAARPAGAVGQAARGAARAHRSWPAAPAPGPPRRSARQAGGPAGRRAPSRR
jgi:hypothetical protein